MSDKPLLDRLRGGASGDDHEVRHTLDLGADVSDRDLAKALVRRIASERRSRVEVRRERVSDPRTTATPPVMAPPDSSFLGRLSTTAGSDEESPGVAELDDVHTLLAILRVGTLVQRRAAALRIRSRLEEGELESSEVRAVSTTLLNLRDVDITFELASAREALPGARGREARQEGEEFDEHLARLQISIDNFWAGLTADEPIASLPADERARLMVRLRDAPDHVLAHIGSVLDGSDGVSDRAGRLALLSSVRHSADPRLVPPLLSLLSAQGAEFVAEAARALARIDDPRVHPGLAAAYERSVSDPERPIIAGALAIGGDVRGGDYVRTLLSSNDERVLVAAVEAMESLATGEDCERLIPLLERTDPVLLANVIRALGRTGDPRALLALTELRREKGLSALFVDAEDAQAAARALMELRGEEPPADMEAVELATASRSGMAERTRDPIVVRISGWWDFMIGHMWLGLGAVKRAIARFEKAAARRPGWSAPLTALALHHSRKMRLAQALAAFRRALEADRGSVERNILAIRSLTQVFLRRAEEVEKSGRVDIARGLIEEVLSLDLRRAASEIRSELKRVQERLRNRSSA